MAAHEPDLVPLSLDDVLSSAEFRRHLRELNAICAAHGPDEGQDPSGRFAIEGGLLYHHVTAYDVDAPPDPARHEKMRNYLLAIGPNRTMLEIGINAGHSALLALSASPALRLTGIDICVHGYTLPAVAYLEGAFGERFRFWRGDSREVLPLIATHSRESFDLFHVDGGHGVQTCRTDISNCLRLAMEHSTLLLDDASAPHIRAVYAEFASLGFLSTESLGGLFVPSDQLLAQIRPRTRARMPVGEEGGAPGRPTRDLGRILRRFVRSLGRGRRESPGTPPRHGRRS